MELHIIRTVYKDFAACEDVKCLCGETYKHHKIDNRMCCVECSIPLSFNEFTVTSTNSERTLKHPIGFCRGCNGIDLKNWGKKDEILRAFRNGNNDFEIKEE
jgi:hypothetical protein